MEKQQSMESTKSVKLKPGKYYLRRERDGAGDAGPMLKSLKMPENKDECFIDELEQVGEMGEIHLGCRIQCGSIFARTFATDWWLTTEVSEFLGISLDDEGDVINVRFKTGNSIYEAGAIR